MNTPICCGEYMLLAGEYLHCQKCDNRFLIHRTGQADQKKTDAALILQLIFEFVREWDISWSELNSMIHLEWQEARYE